MFRATNSPIIRSTFWLHIQLLYNAPTLLSTGVAVEMERHFHLNRGTGRQNCWCIVPNAVYRVKKWSRGWANLSPETCRAELKRLIKWKSCCILLVVYIVVLVMHAHTNIKFCAVNIASQWNVLNSKTRSILIFDIWISGRDNPNALTSRSLTFST